MGKIVKSDYSEEMKSAYLAYAMAVITDRALPDLRDGFKPVHRRIIYSMYSDGITWDKKLFKCADIVGRVLGKYHPHGDTAVYDAMVRMAQDFSLRYPFVFGQGNFGSIDGDGAAAYRYTEAKLRKIADLAAKYIEYDTVIMQKSYNEMYSEPTVLPVLFPNLLVNGVSGIAVGMTTNIPSHNLGEAIDATIGLLDNPKIETRELMSFIKGPDFPTGGTITNKKELLDLYTNGVGNITIRGNHVIEKNKIIIKEIPYTMSGKQNKLVESIIKLAQSKKELMISHVSDESSMEGIRIVIDCKKNADIETIIQHLYKFTPYEDTFNYYFLCLLNGAPLKFSLKEYLAEFIKFQKEIYVKRAKYILDKNKIKVERLEGLIKAYEFIDPIIAVVRNVNKEAEQIRIISTGDATSIPNISNKIKGQISKFSFTEFQAKCIVDLHLKNLSNLQKDEFSEEIAKLLIENNKLQGILDSDKKLIAEIKRNLLEIKKEFSDKRRTQIKDSISKFAPIVENYNCVVEDGYLKKYKISNQEKVVSDKIIIVTEDGGIVIVKEKDIPICSIKDKGIAAENFTKDKICGTFSNEVELVFITESGYGKKVKIAEFDISRSKLKGYLKNDKLIYVGPLSTEIYAVFENGKEKKINMNTLPSLSRSAKGNKIVQKNISFMVVKK